MSLPLPSSAELCELLHDVRLQLGRRGESSLRALQSAFEVNGAPPAASGRVEVETLERVLARVGVFLRVQQLSAWFRYLDREGRGAVLTSDVLSSVQGSLSARRHRLVVQVYRALDAERSGAVPLQRALSAFDASAHPAVLDGGRSAAAVSADLRAAFKGAADPIGAEEWVDRYAAISAVVPVDDDFFCAALERCWRVQEPRGDSRLALLNRVRHILRERTSQRDSGPKTESERLRVMLKWWDLEDSGRVSFAQFHGALQRFGLVLDDQSTRALFDAFDPQRSGRIPYNEFVAVLYEDDIVSTYWTQRQQRERQQQQAGGRPHEEEEKRAYVEDSHALIATALSQPRAQPADAVLQPGPAAPVALSSTSTRPIALFVLGAPGCGKGTQCARLVAEFGFEHLSTGDLLRAEQLREDSELRPLIAACIAEGRLVPSELITRVLDAAIARALQQGRRLFLVDGFPRALEQVEAWDDAVASKRGVAVPFVLFFDCPFSVLEQRLIQRGVSSGRADDNAEAIQKRFVTFDTESRPVVRHFAAEGRVRVLDGTQTPDAVYAQIRALVQPIVAQR